jgi:cation diffusion facilitator family transporter
MHSQNLERWHSHDFVPPSHRRGERQTRIVIVLTAAMMVIEIAAGSVFNSMALLADGWHMASHASALSITAFAYLYARRRAGDARFSFGTWKVSVLGGYSSAVVLAVIALLIAWESVGRFFEPQDISFDEATLVASVGLVVNLLSAYLLSDGHSHSHAGHEHHDHNLRSAYLHVLADALTSVTAIVALLTGKFFGWVWMDPMMGIVGSLVIARWSYGLLRDTSGVLLDGSVPAESVASIREALESGSAGDMVSDLHVWPLGPGQLAVVASVVSDHPRSPSDYKALLADRRELKHLTVEVNRCSGHEGVPA